MPFSQEYFLPCTTTLNITITTTMLQALLRHVAHPHPALRANLLLLVGKLRLRRLQTVIRTPSPSPSGGKTPPAAPAAHATAVADDNAGGAAPSHGSTLAAAESPQAALFSRRLKDAAVTALTAALRVSFAWGGHDRGILSGACMSLVVLYFTTAASPSGEGKSPEEGARGMTASEGTAGEETGEGGGMKVSGR